jgi:hypothetical protein
MRVLRVDEEVEVVEVDESDEVEILAEEEKEDEEELEGFKGMLVRTEVGGAGKGAQTELGLDKESSERASSRIC